MSRSPLSPWEMLPLFIMVALGEQNLEPLMRRLIDMVNGTQNTVKEMQSGINTMHSAIYQLMMPPGSNTPRKQPGAELDSDPPANDLLPLDQPHYQNDKDSDIKPVFEQPVEQPLEQLTDEQPATAPVNTHSTSSPDAGEITTTTAIKPPPSVLPAEMPK